VLDRVAEKRGGNGQVVVEMLLILPVFLTIVFSIMEMGNVAFWVIMLNHATYECARVGAMRAWPRNGGNQPNDMSGMMDGIMKTIIKDGRVTGTAAPTLTDRQSGNQNYDLIVTGKCDVQMLFPISSILFSSPLGCPQGPGGGKCTLTVSVRMPVEQPLSK
jgi:Flp pilus assembly protein TadG